MYGLSDPLKDATDATVDIVFVHGLHGDREKTWTKYKVFWPKTLLPDAVPQARILSWGYDSNIAHFWSKASQNEINSHSSNLCADLIGLRDSTKTCDRPIIFVAHSLGGLIVANALVQGQNHPDQHIENIAKRTRGIVFLGTPHEGSNKTKWAETGQKFLKLFGKDTNKEIISVLKEDSVKLGELGDAFPIFLRSRRESQEPKTTVEVVCFFEEYETSIGMIVTKSAASLAGYEKLSIPADHQDMCKFADKRDVGYQRVSDILKRWMRMLGEPRGTEMPNYSVYQAGSTFGSNNSGTQVGNVYSIGAPINIGR